MEFRSCKKCGEEKPLSTEFFNKLPSGNYRGTCKKCMAEHTKLHYYLDPRKVIARVKKYQDQLKIAGGSYNQIDIESIRSFLGDKCFYCGVDLDGWGEIDHMTPVSKGGSSFPENLTLACRTCNRDKHNKTAEEFFEWRIQRGLKTRIF